MGTPFLYPNFYEEGKQEKGFKPTCRISQVADVPQLEIIPRRTAGERIQTAGKRVCRDADEAEKKSRRAVEKFQSCCMVEGLRPAESARNRSWREGERAER